MISKEKPAIHFMRIPCIWQLFLCCCVHNSLIFGFPQFYYSVSQCGRLWIYPAYSWTFSDMYIHVFPKIWEVSSHYVFKYFLSLFSLKFLCTYGVTFDGLPRVPQVLFIFSHSFKFLIPILNNFNSLISRLTGPFLLVARICYWTPLGSLFISVTGLLNSRISVCFHFLIDYLEWFEVHRKMEWKLQRIPIYPLSPNMHSLPIHILH